MSRSPHDRHFAAKWAAQCARKDMWRNNLAPDTGVVQPAERTTSGGVANHAERANLPTTSRAATNDAETLGSQQAIVGPLTPSKYRNVRTGAYASRREAKRAAELRLLERAGAIRNLREQVPFLLIPAQEGERACYYQADFVYEDEPKHAVGPLSEWHTVVEDCKGMRTPEYIIKRKLLRFTYGIVIRET